MNDRLAMSNHFDTIRILNELSRERDIEFRTNRGEVARLYKSDTSCTGFMDSHPDAQLRFAVENGLFPEG